MKTFPLNLTLIELSQVKEALLVADRVETTFGDPARYHAVNQRILALIDQTVAKRPVRVKAQRKGLV